MNNDDRHLSAAYFVGGVYHNCRGGSLDTAFDEIFHSVELPKN